MSAEPSGSNFAHGPDRPLNNSERSESTESKTDNGTINVGIRQTIEKFLQVNPSMGKTALVDLLMRRNPDLLRAEAWIEVSHYFNNRT